MAFKHVTLSPDERTDVLAFWRDYVLSGGEGDAPSAFMLDALNDETVRDTFLFWHVGGDPFAGETSAWADNPLVKGAMDTLGPVPTNYTNVVKAMTKAVEELNASDPDLDALDTSTVLVIAHVMLGMLLKKFDEATTLLGDIIRLNAQLARKDPTFEVIHQGPMEAMGIALAIIKAAHKDGHHEQVDQMLKDVFAVKRLPVLVNTGRELDESA